QNGGSESPLALVAHLDHPGLEIIATGPGNHAKAALLGGVPPACFERPVPVLISSRSQTVAGTIVGYETDPKTNRVASLALHVQGSIAAGDFGVFDLTGFHATGGTIQMRAADDLVGVAAALLAMQEIQRRGIAATVYGVFTRAEEIGLVGASLVAEGALLPAETIIVSLECSKALPGAEPGRGPVIRVGDRTSAFHPEGEAVLLAARERIPDVPVQRQLMSGGTCEATAFGQRQYRTTGVAIPLVNYHNVGPDEVIAPEQIQTSDFLGEVALLVAAAEVVDTRPVSTVTRGLEAAVNRYRERLIATAGEFQALAKAPRPDGGGSAG
ncbi:MAG TPA: hypothetical protein VFZ25_10480, partial [Chloroflexota bacterium]|nr:hypothetical protein [Chloroflexota bacterium]